MKQYFFSERYIAFTSKKPKNTDKNTQIVCIKKQTIKQMISTFLDNGIDNFIVVTPDVKHSDKKFKEQFKIVKAAGGLVSNTSGKLLFIKRLNRWDLPKGHLEFEENKRKGAIREVEEECGIQQINITHKLPTSWHSYTYKGKTVLKKTFWYAMKTTDTNKPQPQLEEGITVAKWVNRRKVDKILKSTWPSLINVLESFLTQPNIK